MDLPVKISGYRSRPINGLIDFLDDGSRDDSFDPGARRQVDWDKCFRVHKVGATSVDVHGGPALLWAVGTHYYLGLTVDDASASDTPDKVKTITGIAASGYIAISLNSPTAPTTLTAAFSADPPEDTGVTIPIAKITFSGGAITKIVQLHTGLWDTGVSVSSLVDNLSINLNAAGKEQAYGWSDQAADASPAETVELFWRAAMGGAAGYSTFAALINNCITPGDWLALEGFIQGLIDAAVITDHGLLDGLNDGTDDVDHSWAMCNTTDGYDSTYQRNFCSSLGRAIDSLAIDMVNSQLVNGDATLDWALAELLGDWVCTGTTDATSSTVAAFMVAGGISAGLAAWIGTICHADKGFQINATNYWGEIDPMYTDFLVDVGRLITLKSGGNIRLESTNGALDIVPFGSVNMTLSPSNSIVVNSLPGQSVTDIFEKGVFIGSDWSALENVYFHDADGAEIGPYKVLVQQ